MCGQLADENNRLFVRTVLESENACVNYLREYGLFCEPPTCEARRDEDCEKTMEERYRSNDLWWRCPDSKCATYRSLASCNNFFVRTGIDRRSKRQLKLTDIAQIVWLWAYARMNMPEAAVAAGVSQQTICTSYAKCRNECTVMESNLLKPRGTFTNRYKSTNPTSPGRRKNNLGRLAKGDKKPPGEAAAARQMEIEYASWGLWTPRPL